METLDHRELKRLAAAFLSRLGCVVVASEVACPIARYRVDVAGWCELGDDPFARRDPRVSRATLWSGTMRDDDSTSTARDGGSAGAEPDDGDGATGDAGEAASPVASATTSTRRSHTHSRERGHGMRGARTIVIECKQSRADFLRDDARLDELTRERERLHERKRDLEESLVKRYEPQLRVGGSSLYAECEEWRFEESRIATYRKVLVALRRVDELIHGETKFCLLSRYRLADRLYVAAPVGLIAPRELPSGWGLLECRRRTLRTGGARVSELDDLPVNETVQAPALASPEHRRWRLLRNMAVAATRTTRPNTNDA